MRVKIERLGINGEGVGLISEGDNTGKVIFVHGALPTEEVDVDIIKTTKNFCVGKIIKRYNDSKCRKSPECKYFGECGGCQLQHINNESQRKFKLESVANTIKKIAKIDFNISEIIYDNEWGYRNKMVFPIGSSDIGGFIGMFKEESHEVIEVKNCMIANEKINLVINLLSDYVKNNYKGYDFKNNSGDIKYLVIRVNDDAILITFVATKKVPLKNIYNILCKHLKNVGLSLIISDNNDEILSGKYYHIDGIQKLTFDEFGIKYHVDNRGFLQVNDKIKHKLYSRVLENIDEKDIVVDGYSGAGLLSGILAKKCKKVTGVEINHSACESAKKLIVENNLNNLIYYEGDFKNYIANCLQDGSVLVLDPPRSGCDGEILKEILKANNILKIIYISCNPATLGRDLGVLKEVFNIKDISLYEMFPNTKHVETLVMMRRKDKKI